MTFYLHKLCKSYLRSLMGHICPPPTQIVACIKQFNHPVKPLVSAKNSTIAVWQ
jgi:hypothetical protein